MTSSTPPVYFTVKRVETLGTNPAAPGTAVVNQCIEVDDRLEGDLRVYTPEGMRQPNSFSTNQLFGGRYFIATSSSAIEAGAVVTVDNTPADTTTINVKPFVTSGAGEASAESQPVGVALQSVGANASIRVAISGICSVVVGEAFTPARGMLLLTSTTTAGRVRIATAGANTPTVGICLTKSAGGNFLAGNSVLCALRLGFEMF